MDLVGTEKQKAAATVSHKILYAHWQEHGAIVKDLIKCYGFSGAAAAAGLRSRMHDVHARRPCRRDEGYLRCMHIRVFVSMPSQSANLAVCCGARVS